MIFLANNLGNSNFLHLIIKLGSQWLLEWLRNEEGKARALLLITG